MRILLVSLFIVLLLPLAAFDRSLLFRNLETHFLEPLQSGSTVDWTGGYIFAPSKVPLQRVQPSVRGAAGSITEARIEAREKAREAASLLLMQAIGKIRLDSEGTIYQKMRRDRAFAARLAAVKENFLIKSSRTGEGYVYIELALPFVGPKGLLGALRGSERGLLPEAEETPTTDEVTGVIVDMTLLPGFRPALHPALYNESGLKIYSEQIAGNCVLRRGVASYVSSLDLAHRDLRAGRKPYVVYAIGTNGATGAVIANREANVILQSSSGKRSLRSCRVIFVVKPRTRLPGE